MKYKVTRVLPLFIALLLFALVSLNRGRAQNAEKESTPTVPKAWDEEALASLQVPLASARYSPVFVSPDYYYRIPVRKIYKSYPIYAPGKEPPGYIDWLKHQEPGIAFDASKLRTREDWIKAGELVFNAPITYDALTTVDDLRDPAWYKKTGMPVAKDGTVPFNRYVVGRNGRIYVGEFSCATCHTRVMPDGTVLSGAQGNYPLGRLDELDARKHIGGPDEEKQFLERAKHAFRLGYDVPWAQPNPMQLFEKLSVEDFAAINASFPPGVQARPEASLFYPVKVPDLIGVRERRYLDHTGLQLHRSIGDLMRYAALNQGAAFLSHYGDFLPIGELPDPSTLERYSDEQLYALALYLYSLEPPPNPNKFDALAARGQEIFSRENCARCHTPPLYTNNKLIPVEGFQVPRGHMVKYDILQVSVGTDPGLALNTRRGTGYYKVPSLKGVWYRGPFEHAGSVATLEDWFDPNRLRDDYVPTGYRGPGVKTRAVRGHPFGLDLSKEDRRALIAFLRTL